MNDRDDRLPLPHESEHERKIRHRLAELLDTSPIPPTELVDNLALYLRCQPLADLLKQDALYRMITEVPGCIMEFGVHRGRHLATLTALRAHYEPFNPHRHIIGFDTFTGFPGITPVDRADPKTAAGRFAVPVGYLDHLRAVLDAHQDAEHLNHLRRTHIVQGDVRETLPAFLESNPHTVIALAYFDLDLYEPTRDALAAILPYLTRGTVIAFDEVAHTKWPGETRALREVLGTDIGALRTLPGSGTPAYFRWEG
jgi:hypothetical protein